MLNHAPVVLARIASMCLGAHAQESAPPERVLAESGAAIAAAEGLSANVTVRGEGSEMIKSTRPSLSGRLTRGTHPELGRTARMIGEFKSTPDASPVAYDIARTSNELIWSDTEAKALNYRTPDVSVRDRAEVFAYFMPAPFVEPTPLRSVLDDAESMEAEQQQTADGVLCDVVLVTFPRADPRSRRAKRTHTKERWYIATTDKLPRRIEQITDAGFLKASLVMEINNVTVAPQTQRDLDVYAPDTFRVVDKRPSATPDAPDAAAKPTPDPAPVTTPKPRVTLAPTFSMTDAQGNTLSTQTQQGRTTILAFGGSWCIPCRDLLPELETIATELAGSTDVIYAAVRERDPQAAAQTHASASYTTIPETPASVVSAFKVRIYPTIAVIGPDGALLYEGHITKDLDAKALAAAAKDAATNAATP
jgi:thiol-disulfide isomerase/thioredoxin